MMANEAQPQIEQPELFEWTDAVLHGRTAPAEETTSAPAAPAGDTQTAGLIDFAFGQSTEHISQRFADHIANNRKELGEKDRQIRDLQRQLDQRNQQPQAPPPPQVSSYAVPDNELVAFQQRVTAMDTAMETKGAFSSVLEQAIELAQRRTLAHVYDELVPAIAAELNAVKGQYGQLQQSTARSAEPGQVAAMLADFGVEGDPIAIIAAADAMMADYPDMSREAAVLRATLKLRQPAAPAPAAPLPPRLPGSAGSAQPPTRPVAPTSQPQVRRLDANARAFTLLQGLGK